MNITKFLRAAFRIPSMVAAYPLHVITRFDSSIEKMKRLRAIKVQTFSILCFIDSSYKSYGRLTSNPINYR